MFVAVATSNVDDVRKVLDYYGQFDDPLLAFRENQKKLQVSSKHNVLMFISLLNKYEPA